LDFSGFNYGEGESFTPTANANSGWGGCQEPQQDFGEEEAPLEIGEGGRSGSDISAVLTDSRGRDLLTGKDLSGVRQLHHIAAVGFRRLQRAVIESFIFTG
jgi:hypothetical protein